jgi:AraC family transcriptional regulator
MTTPRSTYIARINRVIDHIDAHLADPLDLETLAAVAHFSAFHFHRIFRTMTGETLGDWVRRRRLEIAAGRLVSSPGTSATRIALDVGFASPEVFTRAFRAYFGVTPGAWRQGAHRPWAQRSTSD